MCSAGSDDNGWIVGHEICPLARQSGELPSIVVEENAVLTPRWAALD
jgi:hypothetical protein